VAATISTTQFACCSTVPRLPYSWVFTGRGHATIEMSLHDWADGSQIVIATAAALTFVVAFLAAGIAYRQWTTFKRFELLKMIENKENREARDMLNKHLFMITPLPEWWKYNDELERAASKVCATYDIVGLVSGRCDRVFFGKEWGHSIRWTHEVLNTYLGFRRNNNPLHYRNYDALYEVSKRYHSPRPRPLREPAALRAHLIEMQSLDVSIRRIKQARS